MRKRTTTNKPIPWDDIFQRISSALGQDFLAGIGVIQQEWGARNPFHVLISTIISLRTRDEVTIAASRRLFAQAPTAATMRACTAEEISACIYPAGFYRTKAASIQQIAEIIHTQYGGEVPQEMDQLLALPGVGRKTANLVLSMGFGIPAICVDIHVHRIANRCGWVQTKTPEQTEEQLMKILPREYWIPINEWLVGFGQQICQPRSPFCSHCPLLSDCPRHGVTHSR